MLAYSSLSRLHTRSAARASPIPFIAIRSQVKVLAVEGATAEPVVQKAAPKKKEALASPPPQLAEKPAGPKAELVQQAQKVVQPPRAPRTPRLQRDASVASKSADDGGPAKSSFSDERTPAEKEEAWAKLVAAHANKEAVTLRVSGMNAGGVYGSMGGARAFIPYVKLDPARIKNMPRGDLQYLVGSKIRAQIVSLDGSKSRKEAVLSEQLLMTTESLQQIKVGDVLEGVVSGIEDYGAFVRPTQHPMVSGLVYKDEVSWEKVVTVDAILQKGQAVTVKVIGIDADASKLSLSIKALQADPLKAGMEQLAWRAVDHELAPEVKRFLARLAEAEGVTSVSASRQATDSHKVAQELEVYLTRADAVGEFCVAARLGSEVTEVQAVTTLSREDMKQLLQRVIKA